MPPRKFIESLNDAIEGLIRIFQEQRNMKLHLIGSLFLLVLGLSIGMGKMELLLLFIVLGLILLMEAINSSIEKTLDFFHPHYDTTIKIIKDMWAGAVLFSGILAGCVVYLLFVPYLRIPIENGIMRLKNAHWYLSFFTLLFIIALVIMIKTIFQRGRPLRGGLPSGHSAVAFSIWTIVLLLKPDLFIATIVFLLAVLVSASRIKQGIHSFYEVLLGALIGFFLTLLIFQIFT